jgi:hypothetical protein
MEKKMDAPITENLAGILIERFHGIIKIASEKKKNIQGSIESTPFTFLALNELSKTPVI